MNTLALTIAAHERKTSDNTIRADNIVMALAGMPTLMMADAPHLVTASGDVVHLEHAKAAALEGCALQIAPEQSGSGTPSPTNVRPISGWTGANIVVSPTTTAADGTTYPVSWQTEAGTVYGGHVDLITGTLTVEYDWVDLSTLQWYYSSSAKGTFRGKGLEEYIVAPTDYETMPYGLCEVYQMALSNDLVRNGVTGISINTDSQVFVHDAEYGSSVVSFANSVSGKKLLYKLKTPHVYTLTPVAVKTLNGENYIWANCGDITVQYWAK